MAITLRHDAAAVALPSSSSTRKYGQQLVLQQQQQKYAAQQAGYDRMFDAYKQNNQNQFQFARDQFQNDMAFRRENRQNDFVLGRDKALFDQQQQMQEAERQRAFMEDARKMSSGMIMDDIQNGNYDPATARQLQQNLVAESEALGNPQYDATQRAEALQKIRAARALLTSNRLQKPPPPTAQELHDQSVVVQDGVSGQTNSKGEFVPFKKEQQRPTSADEAFKADPKVRNQYFEDAKSIVTADGGTYDEAARKKAMAMAKKLYEEDNGLGQPTAAPSLPGAAPPVSPGTERSILEPSQAPPQPGAAPAIPGEPSSILDEPIPSQQDGLKAEYHAEMTAKGYQLVTPPDGGRPYYYHPGPNNTPEATPQAQAAQNKWEDVAVPTAPKSPGVDQSGNGLTGDAAKAWNDVETKALALAEARKAPAASQPTAAQPAGSAAPDFGALASSASDDADRAFIGNMRGIYEGQPPEVQTAIGVLLSPSSSRQEAAQALMYLQEKGIDVEKLASNRTSQNQVRSGAIKGSGMPGIGRSAH